MTFKMKLLITFVLGHPLVILTKFDQNLIKLWKKKQIEKKKKKERNEKKERKKSQLETAPFLRARGKLGGMLKRRLYEPRIWTLIWFNIILSSGAKGWLSSNVIRMPLTNFKRF